MRNLLLRFFRDDQGQDLVEYTLLAAFIALGCMGAIGALGGSLRTGLNGIAVAVGSAGS